MSFTAAAVSFDSTAGDFRYRNDRVDFGGWQRKADAESEGVRCLTFLDPVVSSTEVTDF
jgi:hypothetical protein